MTKTSRPKVRLEHLYEFPGHLIRRAHQISGAMFDRHLGEFELTAVQYMAMVAIGSNPATDATRLSDMIVFDRATIGGVIDRLETKGLVVRTPSTTDRRTKGLSLSEQGRALLDKVEGRVVKVQDDILKPLSTTERRQLITLLKKLVSLHTEGELAQRDGTN
jgi:DNA-binding MarR family transcriptional regulator